jgi:hypothetical protein
MSGMVKVRNLNTIPFEVTWRDEAIKIPAGGYIEMDWEDANVFVKTPFKSIVRDGMGNDLPQGKQALRIERDGDLKKYAAKLSPHCPVCREVLGSWEMLDKHTEEMHAAQLVRYEDAEKFMEANKSGGKQKPAAGASA